ncbi:hypothetical protein J5751_06840 [bacterium]|nr:hypothetical protein [bacterium]
MNKSFKKFKIVSLTIVIACLLSSCYPKHMPERFLDGEQQVAVVESIAVKQYNWEQKNNYLLMQVNGKTRLKSFATFGDAPCALKRGDTIMVFVLPNGELDSPSFYW